MLSVFPAPAGINLMQYAPDPVLRRVPRASGDKPHPFKFHQIANQCSPRQRG